MCGIRSKRVQQRLLQESELTYEKALNIAQSAEIAEKDAKRLQPTPSVDKLMTEVEDRPVHKLQQRRPKFTKRGQDKQSTPNEACHRCGGTGHSPTHCKFKEYKCHYCKNKGHLAAVCRKKRRDTDAGEVTGKIERTTEVLSEDEYPLYTVSGGRAEPVVVDITLNGIETKMEVDTGASVSLISEDTYELIKSKDTHLRPVKGKLLTFTRQFIPVRGEVDVTVEHKGQKASLPLMVVQGSYPALLGRNWLTVVKLDWQRIFLVRSERRLQDVLDKHKNVFRKGLGRLKGVTAKIHVDPEVTPKFYKARTVPYATRAKLEEELDRLQSMGVIRPVQFSDWATPVVPVSKKNGSVRLCGDYRITVNQAAKVDKYPLPRIEDLFASLSRGQQFTKLDLKHAYQQI